MANYKSKRELISGNEELAVIIADLLHGQYKSDIHNTGYGEFQIGLYNEHGEVLIQNVYDVKVKGNV